MTATVIRGDARNLPLPDASVDLIVTSPPYFGLRSYTDDGGKHYDGQIGSEPTPAEYIAALIECTREWLRVLKPTGSIFVNLGDSYARAGGGGKGSSDGQNNRAERPARRKPRRDMTQADAAWLAGVIDSDGSVSIHLNKQPEGRAPSFVAWLRIGQMRPEVVRRAAEVTGVGQVYQDSRGVWNWSASAQQARWVLSRIHPWLLIKRRQAWAAIEVARHVEERNGRGEYRPLTEDDIAYRQRLRYAVLAWNAGQDHDLVPPEPEPVHLSHFPLVAREKSLMALPEMYRIGCIYELGLIARAVLVWSKPNGLPESVTDRVRRSHEDWVHLTKAPRYFSAVDEIREQHVTRDALTRVRTSSYAEPMSGAMNGAGNPLGKLPGSVWEIATEPLRVPDHLGVDHFAAFPTEWPRRMIQGWSPSGICTACGEGRRPAVASVGLDMNRPQARRAHEIAARAGLTEAHFAALLSAGVSDTGRGAATQSGTGKNTPEVYALAAEARAVLGGYAREYLLRRPTGFRDGCACPDASAPTRPAIVLDPFGGTGTTALVASVLGRQGITVDRSADYCRLARWRTTDPRQRAKAARISAPPVQIDGQQDLFTAAGEVAA